MLFLARLYESTGRAIALPSALALVLASLNVKVLRQSFKGLIFYKSSDGFSLYLV